MKPTYDPPQKCGENLCSWIPRWRHSDIEETAPTAPKPPKSDDPETRQVPGVAAGPEVPSPTPQPDLLRDQQSSGRGARDMQAPNCFPSGRT